MEIILLRKSLDGNHYIDGRDDLAAYDIERLATEYPERTFVVRNEDNEDYHYFANVHTRKSILMQLGVDDKLQSPCSHCQTRNIFTRETCRKCDAGIDASDILQTLLGDSYVKAMAEMEAISYMLSGPRHPGDTFDSHVVHPRQEDSGDPFYEAVSRLQKPVW